MEINKAVTVSALQSINKKKRVKYFYSTQKYIYFIQKYRLVLYLLNH